MCLAVLTYNALNRTKMFWGSLALSVACPSQTAVVTLDQGSTDGTPEWLGHYAKPLFGSFRQARNRHNVGIFAGMNQLWQMADGYDLVCFIHNDLYLFDKGWDLRIKSLFENDSHIGVVGVVGAERIEVNGGRSHVFSNMLEADIHGTRNVMVRRCAVLDGALLCCRASLLQQCQGMDEKYPFHHFYDFDLCMQARACEYEVWYCGVHCHHETGQSASRPEYEEWVASQLKVPYGRGDLTAHAQSTDRFRTKWAASLPCEVRE